MQNDRLALPLLLLLLTVLVPSVGVVWMMREAVTNERLATSQRLHDAYLAQLETASRTIQQRWADQLMQLSKQVDEQHPAQSFAEIVTSRDFDTVLIRNAQRDVIYPNRLAGSKFDMEIPVGFFSAEQLEFVD